jgi:hypothetical protein
VPPHRQDDHAVEVIFARLPRTIPLQLGISWGLEGDLPLDDELRFRV